MSRAFYALTAAAWAAFFYNFPYEKLSTSRELVASPTPAPPSWSFFGFSSNMTQASATPSPMVLLWPVVGPAATAVLSHVGPVASAAQTAWAKVQPSATAFADSAKQVWIFVSSPPVSKGVRFNDEFGLFVVCICFIMGWFLLTKRRTLPPAYRNVDEYLVERTAVYYLNLENVDNLKTQDTDNDVLTLRNGKRIQRT